MQTKHIQTNTEALLNPAQSSEFRMLIATGIKLPLNI